VSVAHLVEVRRMRMSIYKRDNATIRLCTRPLALKVLINELAQFDSAKSDYSKARKKSEKFKPKAASVFS